MLVYDLGMNVGENTAYYLDKGFSVLAVEANPALCEQASRRFKFDDVTILNLAICDDVGEVEFYVNETNNRWGSLHRQWADKGGGPITKIRVPSTTLTNLLKQYGTPHYIKVDIEGADKSVLEQLAACSQKPEYLSVEDCRFGYGYLGLMRQCGYKRFQIVDQTKTPLVFGSDLTWLGYDAAIDLYSKKVRDRTGKRIAPPNVWFDIHCGA